MRFTKVPLKDIVWTKSGNSKLIKGKLPKASGDGLYPAFSASGQDVWTEQAEYHGDGIILSAVGARCGKCFLATGSWTAIANTHVLIPDTAKVLQKYLWYLVNDEAFWSRSGSAQPFVSMKKSLEKSIPLPDLVSQQAIVDEIETQFARLDDAESALRRVEVRLEKLIDSHLQVFQSNNEQELKFEVQYRTLGELTSVRGGIQKQPKRTPKNNPYPFLRVANVLKGKLHLDEIHEVELFGDEIGRYRLQRGDLLIVEGNGSPAQIGRMAVWDGSIRDCVHQNHLIRARPGNDVLPEYLEMYWNSPTGRESILALAASTSGLYTLSVSKVSRIPIPLPPIDQQAELVKDFQLLTSRVAAMHKTNRDSQQRITHLRQAILKNAFEGNHGQ